MDSMEALDKKLTSEDYDKNYLDLLAIPQLREKNFFIPDYQRGYRWGTRQVEQLMNDLSMFFSEKGQGNFYCLQQVVVKQMDANEVAKYNLKSNFDDNKWYELIDGQQRLTTIRIIFALEHLLDSENDDRFIIHYQTREKLSEFFDNLKRDGNDKYKIVVNDKGSLDIDSWHILQAANCIMEWLKNGEGKEQGLRYFKGSFYENFMHKKDSGKKSVQVIWYELKDNSDPNETFKRVNDKKVSLNNAELIRAMFLSDSVEYECDDNLILEYDADLQPIVKEREKARKQSHIIEQWDVIEKQLRQPDFWAFITSDGKVGGYSCRIEYLFDLISKKKPSDRDELTTFLRFNEMVEKKEVKGLWNLWLKVESYFATLQSWYSNRDYYHKIGFLIAEQGNSILVDLLDKADKQTKTTFAKNIDWLIKLDITGKNPDADIYSFSYDKNGKQLQSILFFYNVESTRINESQSFFPFKLYKEKYWSLEHIHAQNSDRIDHSDKKKWVTWFVENIKALEHLQNRFSSEDDLLNPTSLIKSLKENMEKVEGNNYVFRDFAVAFDSVSAYFNRMAQNEGGSPEIHTISNMALLDGSVNTIISNSVFEVKRQKIMEEDAKGKYIPYCTRLVFLKYYNKDDENFSVQHTFYWSETDRENYLKDIKIVLADVLSAVDPSKVESSNNEADE